VIKNINIPRYKNIIILSYELQCISPGRTCVLLWIVKNAPEHRTAAVTVKLVTSRVVADRVTAYNNVTSMSILQQ